MVSPTPVKWSTSVASGAVLREGCGVRSIDPRCAHACLPARHPDLKRDRGAPQMRTPAPASTDVQTKETAVYAIVRAGAKQQKVAVGDVIEIDKVLTPVGDTFTLPVVMTVDGDSVTTDTAGLGKASVTVEVLGATK